MVPAAPIFLFWLVVVSAQCGDNGQPCCRDPTGATAPFCNDNTMTCVGTTIADQTCFLCGGDGQPCCANGPNPCFAPGTSCSDPFVAASLQAGCSDGTREGFSDFNLFPTVAACAGAWTIPGVSNFAPVEAPACPGLFPPDTRSPACNRQSGDDGVNPSGTNCNAADICAVGWHICSSANDFQTASGQTNCNALGAAANSFFVTRQSSNGCAQCSIGTALDSFCNSAGCQAGCQITAFQSNDLFGCGTVGATPTCAALSQFSNDKCSSITSSGFVCNADSAGLCELFTAISTNPNLGGVLCCADSVCVDTDGDGACDFRDNCNIVSNPSQTNTDGDGSGDACDPCPRDPFIDASNYANPPYNGATCQRICLTGSTLNTAATATSNLIASPPFGFPPYFIFNNAFTANNALSVTAAASLSGTDLIIHPSTTLAGQTGILSFTFDVCSIAGGVLLYCATTNLQIAVNDPSCPNLFRCTTAGGVCTCTGGNPC